MRRLRSIQLPGMTVQDVLEEFNDRAEEFGIADEADIVSVSVFPVTHSIPMIFEGKSVMPKIEVAIVFWADR